jgi:hypothetical protein
MNKILFYLIILIPQTIIGQNLNFGVQIGYGTYYLNELKQFQTEATEHFYLTDIKEVEQFPNSIYYSGHLGYSFNTKNQLGIKGNYNTTGGRNHMKDYSGEYKLDLLLNSYSIGLNYKYAFLNKYNFRGHIQIEEGLTYSTLSTVESIHVFNENVFAEDFLFESYSFYIEPSLCLSLRVFRNLYSDLQLGYWFDFKNELRNKEDKNKILGLVGWSGTRLSVGLSYEL